MSDALKETIDEIASLSEADQEKIGRMLLSLIEKLFLCSEFAKDAESALSAGQEARPCRRFCDTCPFSHVHSSRFRMPSLPSEILGSDNPSSRKQSRPRSEVCSLI
jgi:hypothetical protein